MTFSSKSLSLLLLATTSLIVAGCAQQSTWPGGVPDQAEAAPMMAAPIEPVETSPMEDAAVLQRLSRLEQNVGGLEGDVAGLQAEMTAARPQLAKIGELEGKFRQLSLNIPAAPKKVVAVVPAKKPVKAAAKLTVASKATPPMAMSAKPAASLKVEGVRIGEQAGGKTRIVLDTTAPAKIKYDIDNSEKILVVELPSANWAAATSRTLSASPLVASYTAENDAGGSRLIVQLKSAAQVLTSAQVDPDRTGGHRVYLDLVKK